MLPTNGVIMNNRKTSAAVKSTIYVPPTNTNMVNPPSSSGHPSVAQLAVHKPSWGYGYPANQIPIGNMNYQPNPIGMSYTRIPYSGNTFTQ